MPVSSIDLAQADARDALRDTKKLEERVALLEIRLLRAAEIVEGQSKTITGLISIVEQIVENRKKEREQMIGYLDVVIAPVA